jgi:AcrR family transcriptional regulator
VAAVSPRAGLDRATLVAAAAELADAEGPEAVTLARLAARFGVRPPSLYNHVAGLDDLRRELARRGLRDLTDRLLRAAAGRAGDEAVLALGRAYRAFARAHPGLYAATLRAPDPADPVWVHLGDDLVALIADVLAGYGLRGDDALHAIRALRSLLHGFVALEAAGGFGLPLDLDESFQRLLAGYVGGLRHRPDRWAPSTS